MTERIASEANFGNLISSSIKQLDTGLSPIKVLSGFSHSLDHFMDASRNIHLLEMQLYTSYLAGRLLNDYFLIKARPLIIKGIGNSDLSPYVKDSLSVELEELREGYFDADFVPRFSEMRNVLTTIRNLAEISELSKDSVALQKILDTLYDIVSRASKETRNIITEQLTELFRQAYASQESEMFFTKKLKELAGSMFVEIAGW